MVPAGGTDLVSTSSPHLLKSVKFSFHFQVLHACSNLLSFHLEGGGGGGGGG